MDNRERTDGRADADGATTQLSLSSIMRLRNAKARFNLSSFLTSAEVAHARPINASHVAVVVVVPRTDSVVLKSPFRVTKSEEAFDLR